MGHLISHGRSKRPRLHDYFDSLPDDIVLIVLRCLSSSASRPSDLFSFFSTCRRMNDLARHPSILSVASVGALAIRAVNWCDSAHAYLSRCVRLGNLDACYVLGMIAFYCLKDQNGGLLMMAKAGMKGHAPSLYSLAIIHFNGSGLVRCAKFIRFGAVLCARAAMLGNIHALRELGYCFQDGYGVRRDADRAKRYLILANARERWGLSPTARVDVASSFMLDWFGSRTRGGGEGLLKMCTHAGCGRRELRSHEFRRCSVCAGAYYCSRACQTLDWRLRHSLFCTLTVGD